MRLDLLGRVKNRKLASLCSLSVIVFGRPILMQARLGERIQCSFKISKRWIDRELCERRKFFPWYGSDTSRLSFRSDISNPEWG
jgi:hypothetical protein